MLQPWRAPSEKAAGATVWWCVVISSKGLKPGLWEFTVDLWLRVNWNNFLLMLWRQKGMTTFWWCYIMFYGHIVATQDLFLSLSLFAIYMCIRYRYIYIYFCWANALTHLFASTSRARSGEDLSVSSGKKPTNNPADARGFPKKTSQSGIFGHMCFLSTWIEATVAGDARSLEDFGCFSGGEVGITYTSSFLKLRGLSKGSWEISNISMKGDFS